LTTISRPDAGTIGEPTTEGLYVVCRDLFKIYKAQDLEVVALRGLDMHVSKSEIVAIVGASGSGKSTLLNILAGYDTPSAGEIRVGDKDLLNLRGRETEAYRLNEVGFVWQQTGRNLLPYLSARENVELPMLLSRTPRRERQQRSLELLNAVGLEHRITHRPDQLSGGEQQRVSIAIAMANQPSLLLADEPTGELDSETALEVLGLFRSLSERFGTTVVIVTHDPEISAVVDRVVVIRDGRASAEIVALHSFRRPEDGTASDEPREFILVDSSGRLQIPRDFLDHLRIKERAKVELVGDHVIVSPAEEV
jgi:ABC-type lipoprotein export system ATPase subunit